jgi:hypothetical protein
MKKSKAQKIIDQLQKIPQTREMAAHCARENDLYDGLKYALDSMQHGDLPPSVVCSAIIRVLVNYAGWEGITGLSLLQRLSHEVFMHAKANRSKDQPDEFADRFVEGVPSEWQQYKLM